MPAEGKNKTLAHKTRHSSSTTPGSRPQTHRKQKNTQTQNIQSQMHSLGSSHQEPKLTTGLDSGARRHPACLPQKTSKRETTAPTATKIQVTRLKPAHTETRNDRQGSKNKNKKKGRKKKGIQRKKRLRPTREGAGPSRRSEPGRPDRRRQTQRHHQAVILLTTPAPTVRPPSRIANRRPSSMAIGAISLTLILTLSPGITISVPGSSSISPVTSVVRK